MTTHQYKNPESFKAGDRVYLVEEQADGSKIYSVVIFDGYTSSPFCVCVKNSTGQIRRVPRRDLFEEVEKK